MEDLQSRRPSMNKNSKIYLAGHRGLVGSAILKKLQEKGYSNIVVRTHAELDLTRQADVEDFFRDEKPEIVILAAAKVGGIGANSQYPADFIYENLAIALNPGFPRNYTKVKIKAANIKK